MGFEVYSDEILISDKLVYDIEKRLSTLYNVPSFSLHNNLYNALQCVAKNGCIDILEYLIHQIDEKPDLRLELNSLQQHSVLDLGNFMFQCACYHKQHHVIRYIIDHHHYFPHFDPSSSNNYALQAAVTNNDIVLLRYLISLSSTFNSIDIATNNFFAFRIACNNGNIEILNYIIDLNNKALHVIEDDYFLYLLLNQHNVTAICYLLKEYENHFHRNVLMENILLREEIQGWYIHKISSITYDCKAVYLNNNENDKNDKDQISRVSYIIDILTYYYYDHYDKLITSKYCMSLDGISHDILIYDLIVNLQEYHLPGFIKRYYNNRQIYVDLIRKIFYWNNYSKYQIEPIDNEILSESVGILQQVLNYIGIPMKALNC